MIIDPQLNLIDPGQYGLLDEGIVYAKHGEVTSETLPNLEPFPPPYTEIDLERGVIEGPETPFSGHNIQFCRYHMDYSQGGLDAEDRPSGMRKIKEGTKDIYKSLMLVAEMSFLALGACVEGIGKLIYGIGLIIKQHRAPRSLQDN